MEKWLQSRSISPTTYFQRVKEHAESNGYDTSTLAFSNDRIHKFQIQDPRGRIRRFGRVGYGDFHIYSLLAEEGKVPRDLPHSKRNTFRKSHSRIKGDWKKDKYSPNNLALEVLW